MNLATLEKLVKNPHYTLSEQQLQELQRLRTNGGFTIHTQPVTPTDENVAIVKPKVKKDAARRNTLSKS